MLASTLALILAAATGSQWLGVSLGEPAAAVRAALGDPLNEEDLGDGLTKSRYLTADNTAFLGVDRKNGIVVMISFSPVEGESVTVADPFGVKIGDTESRVLAIRGKADSTDNGDGADRWMYGTDPGWRYIFRNGALAMIIASSVSAVQSAETAQSAPSVPPLHTGASIADAIVIKGENEMTGIQWEHAYLAYHPCQDSGKRELVKQALIRSNKRSFDALTTQCPGGSRQTIYFDITDFIGKL